MIFYIFIAQKHPPIESRNLTYIKGLDGMRGLFCLGVIITHWKLAFPIVPFGWEGLQAFFVLSGFLITRILLHDKDKPGGFGRYIKVFYTKRSLRIFPLYFGFLLFWSVVRLVMKQSEFIQTQTEELKHSGVWLYTYLYNFKTWFNLNAGKPFEDTPFFSHLWSLSVEEQFYFVFPLLIFFVRGRLLKFFVILLIFLPVATRFLGYDYMLSRNPDETWAVLLIYRNIFYQFDALALGAALAIFNFDWIKRPWLWSYIVLGVIVLVHILHYPLVRDSFTDISHVPFDIFLSEGKLNVLGYIHFLGHPEIMQYNRMFNYLMPLVNIWCFLLVLTSLKGRTLWPWLFENRFMVYMGKLSYGIYVYHVCVLVFFLKFMHKLLPGDFITGHYGLSIILFAIYLAVLIGISQLSFTYFEGYFLRLKSKMKS